MMQNMASNTRPYISFDVHQCGWFPHVTKVSYGTAVKRMCWYLQGTKEKVIVSNPFNKLGRIVILMQIVWYHGDI